MLKSAQFYGNLLYLLTWVNLLKTRVQKIVLDCGYTVIRFLWVSAKFSTCTVVRVNGTLVEDKMRRFKGECEHFRFNKCPIYTHDGASGKFSTNSQEMDNSVPPTLLSVSCELVLNLALAPSWL